MKLSAVIALTIFLYIEETTAQWDHLYQPKVRPCWKLCFPFRMRYNFCFVSRKTRQHWKNLFCKTAPRSKVQGLKCFVKNIDRYHLKAEISFNFSEPVDNMYLHIEPYFKFARYTRIAGHIWEDFCGWITGKKPSFFLNYYGPISLKYTSASHMCPYSGYYSFKFDNISMESFAFPQILPAGRYYLDMYLTESEQSKSKTLLNMKLYNTVSDHRIEIVW